MPREPDLAFEALEAATFSNRHIERGKINIALAAIRAAWQDEGGLPEDLPDEIHRRAAAYQSKWPMLTITPTALASHWKRVIGQQHGSAKTAQQQALDDLRRETE